MSRLERRIALVVLAIVGLVLLMYLAFPPGEKPKPWSAL